MKHLLLLAACLAPSIARADGSISIGASDRGAVAGAVLAVETGPLQWTARLDAAIAHDRAVDQLELTGGVRHFLAGARLDREHAFALAGVRFGVQSTFEVGALAAIATGDDEMMYVQHARFAPGWFARASIHTHRVVLGGEVGATGLATRHADGELRGDVRALISIGIEVWR